MCTKQKLSESQNNLELFWPSILEEVKRIKTVDAKNQNLPLARIKKIMKLDENAKMIAAEAPLLFAKACELFIQELTMRAWIHTEDNKRRTLQRSDIASAIARYDQFDFLIDIVPREDIKPRKDVEVPKSLVTPTDQVQYYLQLANQQQQQQQQQQSQSQIIQQLNQQTTTPTIQTISSCTTPNVSNVAVSPVAQNILLTTNPATSTDISSNQIHIGNLNPQQQQIQIIQNVLTPTGEMAQVPITLNANQLNLLRMQLSNSNLNLSPMQQVIIPTIQSQQPQTSLVQVNPTAQNIANAAAAAASGGILLNAITPSSGMSTTSTVTSSNKPNIITKFV